LQHNNIRERIRQGDVLDGAGAQQECSERRTFEQWSAQIHQGIGPQHEPFDRRCGRQDRDRPGQTGGTRRPQRHHHLGARPLLGVGDKVGRLHHRVTRTTERDKVVDATAVGAETQHRDALGTQEGDVGLSGFGQDTDGGEVLL
jgi:hypothetical protein